MTVKIGMVAGEASGDILGAGLLTELHHIIPSFEASGIGGTLMKQAGFQSLFDIERLSVMGLIEPLFRLPELFKIRRELIRYFLEMPPSVFIGIDAPDFNRGLELRFHQANIPVVHYVSPSVWAWRKNRIHSIAKAVDLVLTLFPFETKIYEQHHIPVKFVGHPLADLIPLKSDMQEARRALKLEPNTTYIALLPGSRKNEIKYLAELFIQTAEQCYQKNPEVEFITSAANTLRDQEFKAHCQRLAPHLPIHFFVSQSHQVMAAANVVLVTSGTATLETMLFKKPLVIAYRMASLTFQIARHLVKIPYIGLPNLLANEALVPEFIQDAATPEALSAALLNFLNSPTQTQALEAKFTEIHHQLRQNASQQAAKAVAALISK